MKYKTIVRAKGGTAERVVPVEEITIPEIEVLTLLLSSPRMAAKTLALFDALHALLEANNKGCAFPSEIFIPDLWHEMQKLPKEEYEALHDFWGLAHDLVNGMGYKPNKFLSSEDFRGGSRYTRLG